MRNIIFIIVIISSCHSSVKLKLNDSETVFTEFPSADSLMFTKLSNLIVGTPKTILKYGDYLIINTLSKEKWITIYSLKENRVIKEAVNYGKGPNEMISCEIGLIGDQIWFYDITKKEVHIIPVDSLIQNNQVNLEKFKVDRSYYSVKLINDSVMLGTIDWMNPFKFSYINIKNGDVTGIGKYAVLSNDIPLEALMDACCCYIDISPDLKCIALSYRYADVLEIYKKDGTLLHALHGPHVFDIEFNTAASNGHHFMTKTKKTRKAFVNTFVTGKYIYLLFSGHRRNEEEWSTGRYLFIYTWDGKPLKSLYLNYPICSFCVDEKEQVIYSYSMETGELVKAEI